MMSRKKVHNRRAARREYNSTMNRFYTRAAVVLILALAIPASLRPQQPSKPAQPPEDMRCWEVVERTLTGPDRSVAGPSFLRRGGPRGP